MSQSAIPQGHGFQGHSLDEVAHDVGFKVTSILARRVASPTRSRDCADRSNCPARGPGAGRHTRASRATSLCRVSTEQQADRIHGQQRSSAKIDDRYAADRDGMARTLRKPVAGVAPRERVTAGARAGLAPVAVATQRSHRCVTTPRSCRLGAGRRRYRPNVRTCRLPGFQPTPTLAPQFPEPHAALPMRLPRPERALSPLRPSPL